MIDKKFGLCQQARGGKKMDYSGERQGCQGHKCSSPRFASFGSMTDVAAFFCGNAP
jgi:hypothetical protein